MPPNFLSQLQPIRGLARPLHPLEQVARLRHPALWHQLDDGGPKEPKSEEPIAAKMARLLAVLFLAKEPLTTRKLSQYANLADGTEARTLVTHLNRRLDQIGRAFRAEPVAGGYQLVTRPKFAKWLRRLDHVPGEIRLSAPAMETLAVVAYRQPVVRAEIESVRGVSCGEILSQLLNRDLVRISGRSEELGRPYLYNTTKQFLQIFGLKNLEQLPRAEFWHETLEDSTSDDDANDDEQSTTEPTEVEEE